MLKLKQVDSNITKKNSRQIYSSWIKNTDLEPYVEHRDAYVKIIKNPSLKEAVKEADEHLRDLQVKRK